MRRVAQALRAARRFALRVWRCSPALRPARRRKFKASDITGTTFGRDFALTDHNGKQRTLADFRGKVVVLFFGYTQCPDVCPTTLSELADAMQKLGPDADARAGAVRDRRPRARHAELLAQYVPAFNPSLHRAVRRRRGDGATAKEFKIIYQKQPGPTPGSYTMDHSAGTFLFDPQGRLRALRELRTGPRGVRARHRAAAHAASALARSARFSARRLVLDQLDLVAVGVLHERDHRRAALDRARFARDLAALRAHRRARGRGVGHLDRDVAVRGAELVAVDAEL